MSLSDTQAAFAAALRDPESTIPHDLSPTGAVPSRRRFNVYRNNVAVSLREALEAAFPVVREIVGEEFFAAMAQAHVARTLPASPLLIEYGSGFADFIEGFEPAAGLPYLADVARLEHARSTAYHAADAEPLGIAELAGVAAEDIDRVRLGFHPSLVLIASPWPVFSIWQAHQHDDPKAVLATTDFEPEAGLVVRPGLQVHVRQLSAQAYAYCRALREGRTLAQAADDVSELDKVGLSEILSALFELQLVTELHV